MHRFRGILALVVAAVVALISVVQAEAAVTTRVFHIPTANSGTTALVAGPDGNMWFLESGANKVGRITRWGKITEYPIPTPAANLSAAAVGPDGKVWFTESTAGAIASISMAGAVTEYPLPTPNSGPSGIARGSDGRMWITETISNKVAAIDPATAVIVEYASPVVHPMSISSGGDGKLWMLSQGPPGGSISAMTTAGLVSLVKSIPGRSVQDLALGSDGALWVTSFSSFVDRVTTTGSITTFSLPNQLFGSITAGPDGALWFTSGGGSNNRGDLDRLTTTGTFSQIGLRAYPYGVAVGPDGSFWVAERDANALARVRVS